MTDSNLFERWRKKNENLLTSLVFNFIKFVTEELGDDYFIEKLEEQLKISLEVEKTEITLWPQDYKAYGEPDVMIKDENSCIVIENKISNQNFNPEIQWKERDKKILDEFASENYRVRGLRISKGLTPPISLEKYIKNGELKWISWTDIVEWIDDYQTNRVKSKEISFLTHSIKSFCEDIEVVTKFRGFSKEGLEKIGAIVEIVNQSFNLLEELDRLLKEEDFIPYKNSENTVKAQFSSSFTPTDYQGFFPQYMARYYHKPKDIEIPVEIGVNIQFWHKFKMRDGIEPALVCAVSRYPEDKDPEEVNYPLIKCVAYEREDDFTPDRGKIERILNDVPFVDNGKICFWGVKLEEFRDENSHQKNIQKLQKYVVKPLINKYLEYRICKMK